jgi:uncharacterized protein (DUF983 family)
MSTTPPEQPTTPQQSDYGRGGPNVNLNLSALMPTPGNAEMVVYVLGAIIVAIIALAADSVDAPAWVDWFKWVTAAYLISRGIAKASRVLER